MTRSTLVLVLLLGACAAPEPRDPLADPALLPATTFRAAVTPDVVLRLADVVDERGGDQVGTAAERDLTLPATELVRRYLAREIERAGLFQAVRTDAAPAAGLLLEVRLRVFGGDRAGGIAAPAGWGEVEFAVQVTRLADDTRLLERRYVHRVTERRPAFGSADPLALVCQALGEAIQELLVDLDRLDLLAPPGG